MRRRLADGLGVRKLIVVAAALALMANFSFVVGSRSDTGNGKGRGAEGKPKTGGILRVGVEKPRSLDPAQARSSSELLVVDQLFDSLTAYAPDGGVAPSLADQWTASPDQRHWDFHLRPGVTFHDGSPITAADVKYSLERILRKGSGTPELVVALLEPVAGFRAFSRDGTAADLAGITTPAIDVVHFDLDQPLAPLPAILAHPTYGIVPRSAVEAPSPLFASRPVGSGPFRIAGHGMRNRAHDVIRLVRANGAATRVAGVDLHVAPNAATCYRKFRDGKLDWSPVPVDEVEEATERYGSDGFAPYLAVLFYGFNLQNPSFADARFREAIVHAIDRRAIAMAVYGDSVTSMDGPVAKGVPGYQQDPCGPRCRYDPEQARALLREAFPDGGAPEVKIDFDDDSAQSAIARAMQANLAEVGIKAVLRSHSLDHYAQMVDRGEQELFRLGWIGVYPAADNFLTPLFVTGAETNVTGFSSAPVDELLRAARAEPDLARQLSLYRDAERQVMDHVPIVPIAQLQSRSVVAERVRGLTLTPLGIFDAARVWLNDDNR